MSQNKTETTTASTWTVFLDKIWSFFTSLKLAIFLLLILSIVSVVGTIIQQNRPMQEYYKFFRPDTVQIFNKLGLLDMYHSWWFILVLATLGLNIVACTMDRYPAIIRGIKKQNPVLDENLEKSLNPSDKIRYSLSPEVVESRVLGIVEKTFKAKPVITTQEDAKHFYFEKGKYTRLSFFFTHTSLLIIFIGALIGSIFGFKGFVTIVEGEAITNFETRQGVNKELGFVVRCNEFNVDYYANGAPKDYRSNISIIKDGKEITRQLVRVNDPLTYDGITFYQSSYGGLPDVFLEVVSRDGGSHGVVFAPYGKVVEIPGMKTKIEVANYQEDFHAPDGTELGRAIGINIYPDGVRPTGIWLFERYPDIDKNRNDSFYLVVKNVRLKNYTGLQVNKDPGVWVVWLGCFMLVMGIMMAFFTSHKKLWLRIKKDKKERVEVTIGGSANKNRFTFEKEVEKVIESIKEVK